MTAETLAMIAFRAHAAKRLHVPAESFDDDTAYIRGKHDHGAAHAVAVRTKDASRRQIRGWAIADGTVITPGRGLGRLFAEAGVWHQPAPSKLDDLAITLAEDLVWSYGEGAAVESSGGIPYPALQLAADGSGTLVFCSSTESSESDPESSAASSGGGGGAGQFTFQDTVTLTAAHTATLTRKPYQPGAHR